MNEADERVLNGLVKAQLRQLCEQNNVPGRGGREGMIAALRAHFDKAKKAKPAETMNTAPTKPQAALPKASPKVAMTAAPSDNDLECLLHPSKAAAMAGVGERTIWQWMSQGRLSRIKPTPGRTCVSQRELQALIVTMREEAAKEAEQTRKRYAA